MNLLNRIREWWNRVSLCETQGCQNAANATGMCDECNEKEMREIMQRIREDEHQKLVRAFREAIRLESKTKP